MDRHFTYYSKKETKCSVYKMVTVFASSLTLFLLQGCYDWLVDNLNSFNPIEHGMTVIGSTIGV